MMFLISLAYYPEKFSLYYFVPGFYIKSPINPGVVAPCITQPLGMEDGTIADSQITSSGFTFGDRPKYARLNLPSDDSSGQSTGSYGAWCIDTNEKWIQVAFNAQVSLAGVMMQARDYRSAEQWVSQYWVQHSVDGTQWDNVMDAEQEAMVNMCKVLVANL